MADSRPEDIKRLSLAPDMEAPRRRRYKEEQEHEAKVEDTQEEEDNDDDDGGDELQAVPSELPRRINTLGLKKEKDYEDKVKAKEHNGGQKAGSNAALDTMDGNTTEKLDEQEGLGPDETNDTGTPDLENQTTQTRPGAMAVGHRSSSRQGSVSRTRSTQSTAANLSQQDAHFAVVAELVDRTKNLEAFPISMLYHDKRVWTVLCVLLLAVVGLGIGLVLSVMSDGGDEGINNAADGSGSNNGVNNPTAMPTPGLVTLTPSAAPSLFNLEAFLVRFSSDDGVSLTGSGGNAQKDALNWMLNDDVLWYNLPPFRILQRYALQTLRWAVFRETSQDFGWGYDNGTVSECEWSFITCDFQEQVVELSFSSWQYAFILPDELALLSNLRESYRRQHFVPTVVPAFVPILFLYVLKAPLIHSFLTMGAPFCERSTSFSRMRDLLNYQVYSEPTKTKPKGLFRLSLPP